jgi:uncharacterized protein (TIGR02145 family)
MKNIFSITGVILLIFICSSCKKDKPTLPVLITMAVTEISYTTATSGGDVIKEGGASLLSRGVCWSIAANPTISDNKTTGSGGLGAFSSSITLLTSNKVYYVRAYATNIAGTGYGNPETFTTRQITAPAITTNSISAVTQTSALSGGNILTENGGAITARGICWGTTENPSINNNKTTDGTGTGSFVSTLSGLLPNTKYFVRSYAINMAGITYGNEISFSSNPISVPVLTTATITSITQTTAISGGNITSDNGASVTSRGVCWGTAPNPTTVLSTKTTDGTGTGAFESSINGLTTNTTYYVRAYATNSAGTGYGSDISFITSSTQIQLPVITTADASSVTTATATSGGTVSSDGGAAVSIRGVCWSTTASPTISDIKTVNGSGTGSFTSSLTALTAGRLYYVRAYATNSAGTAFGNQISFTTQPISYGTVSDVDGNTYSTVTIGAQEWMTKNLRTTKYNDNTDIPLVADNTVWSNLTSPGYCWYENSLKTYGTLYNWYVINTGRLCPSGWHVPGDADWTTLTTSLGGENIAGGKLKETGTVQWVGPNTGATNETGFTALPGGFRYYVGAFSSVGYEGNWWSSTGTSAPFAWPRGIINNSGNVYIPTFSKRSGFSVRCLRD